MTPPSPTIPPVTPPPWLAEAASRHYGFPVPLRGTPKRVEWAEKLRRVRLATARRQDDMVLVAALAIVKDATWWKAAAEVPLAEIKWPSPDQVEDPRDSDQPHPGF